MGHTPRKRFGQNFLRNPSAAEKIVRAIEPAEGETIVEIGPGLGALTEKLAQVPNRVVAIEIDRDLVPKLRARYEGRIEIVEGDAIDAPLPEGPFRAVGNLPYNVATPIVRRCVAAPGFVRGVFMLQKEVADRLVAGAGEENYGFLTLHVRIFADARIMMTLEPGSFHPRPKVRSAVVVLDRARRDLASPVDELVQLISASFRMPRKTIVNNVTGFRDLSKHDATRLVAAAGLSEGVRPGSLSLDQFDQLAVLIAGHRDAGGAARR